MKTIYKYTLGPEIELPKGALIVAVGEQYGVMFLWANVDTDAPKEIRTFEAIATGECMDDFDNMQYIGTIFMNSGLVFHIHEHTN